MTAPPEFEACQECIRLRHNAERPAKAGLFPEGKDESERNARAAAAMW